MLLRTMEWLLALTGGGLYLAGKFAAEPIAGHQLMSVGVAFVCMAAVVAARRALIAERNPIPPLLIAPLLIALRLLDALGRPDSPLTTALGVGLLATVIWIGTYLLRSAKVSLLTK